MNKRYQPQAFEQDIYNLWEKNKVFTAIKDKKKQPFCIVMPPPNANAPLHIGHAMFLTVEDILARFQRMKGLSVLLLPGADHAGILTQVVFEKKLAKEGKTRFDLGRKKFFKECLCFTLKNKEIMYDQFKKLGTSCDWTREKFTLDKDVSKQVLLTFIKLYKEGLAYRGTRLINWCPRCMTALSDLEVEYKEIKSKLWYIKYPLKDKAQITGQQRFLVVATTRPETMMGDTAVAVNPEDTRYQKFIGQTIKLPIVKREIPVIADNYVDPEFGTGVVKVTPAHDSDDWKVGEKHQLKVISVIDFNNRMNKNAGSYIGLKANDARAKIIEYLNRKNLLIKERAYLHSVGHCERCKTIIEPMVSRQWFISTTKKINIKTKDLKNLLKTDKAALKEFGSLPVKNKLVKILPKRFKKNYLDWMNNLHDWCVSRQLWWGHRLPIWYCGSNGLSSLQKQMNPKLAQKKQGCGHTMVTINKPKKCDKCGKKTTIIQDPDTFDTWFSSGQWAHNALGYPNGSDYKYWYPTSVMETGYEILPIWVAKMIMLSLFQTKMPPFHTVYLHGLVRDAFGEKMSKSKGNVVDPLKVISQHGADALRMALIVGASPGNDVSVGDDKIKGYRNFANKVWNIGRFIFLNLEKTNKKIPLYHPTLKGLKKEDKSIIGGLEKIISKITEHLENYKFSLAGELIYQFLWHEFADKYLEASKKRLEEKDPVVLAVLTHVYLTSLKLLHPFMPFVTETIWQQFPQAKGLLASSFWPKK